MESTNLGRTGLLVSRLCLGTMNFGPKTEERDSYAIMDRALDQGINFFDSANVYAAGRCEEVWAELLKDRRRDQYVLATKVYFPMGTGPNDKGLSRKHIMEQCHASLRRLRTDYVDLYQCHRFDTETPLEETVRAMDDLTRQGKILYWGFSEWTAEQIEQALRLCGQRGFDRPKSSQPMYNLLHRGPEQAVMPLSHRAGIGQIVYCPLAQGVLSGKYKPGQPLPAQSRANDERQNQFIKGMVQDKSLREKVQRLAPLAAEQQMTMSQLALAWILRRAEVSSCIIGATRPEQVDENAEASGVKLDDAVIRRMEEIVS